jgi:hypothetical protein
MRKAGRRQMRNRALLMIISLVLASAAAFAQTATGRSNTGAIVPPTKKSSPAEIVASPWPLKMDLEFTEPSGNGLLDPKERGRLRVVLTNPGGSTARGVSVKVTPMENEAGLTVNEVIVVGDIPSEAVRYAFFYVSAGQRVAAPSARFLVRAFDANEKEIAEPKTLAVSARVGG